MRLATLLSGRGRCGGLIVAAMSLVGSGLTQLRADLTTVGPVVELPKFVVTDSRELPPPESWRYGTIPGFEILSNASDKQTQRLISDFELFRIALSAVWRMPDQMHTPVLLILCGSGAKFDAFVPEQAKAGPTIARASLFLKGRNRTAIVIDTESTVINVLSPDVDDPATGVDSTRLAIEHNKQLYREYVRYMLSKSDPRLPAWFEEGMAQIVMAMKIDPKLIEFGKLEDPRTVSIEAEARASLNATLTQQEIEAADQPAAPAEDRDFNVVLARRALIPFGTFLAIGHDAPEAMNPLGNNIWAKQAYAFVHMGLYGENGRWQKQFAQFLVRSSREPVTEELFRKCFNMSYGDMGLALRGYIQSTDYKIQEFRLKGGGGLPIPPPIELRDATPSEIGRIKGNALLLAGHAAAARTEFIAPYIRGQRDADLLAALGLIEQLERKDDRARKLLAAAVTGKTTDPDAYVALARYQFADATAAAGGPDQPLTDEQAAGILALLGSARRLPPPDPATYELLAQVLAQRTKKAEAAEVALLIEGARLFPARLRLVYAAAALCVDAGLLEPAHLLADHGLRFAPDAATKAMFERLKTAMPPLPAATAAAAPAATSASAQIPAAALK